MSNNSSLEGNEIQNLINNLYKVGLKDYRQIRYRLVAIGEPAVKPLIDRFRDADTSAKYRGSPDNEIVNVLGKMGSVAVLPLIEALNEDDYKVRAGVAQALGQISDPQAVEPLIKSLLRFDDNTACRAAVIALDKLRDRRALVPLIKALVFGGHTRSYVMNALLAFDEDLIPLLLEELSTNDKYLRKGIIVFLSELNDGRTIKPLIQIFENTDEEIEIRIEAATTLGRIGAKEALPMLKEALITNKNKRDFEQADWFERVIKFSIDRIELGK